MRFRNEVTHVILGIWCKFRILLKQCPLLLLVIQAQAIEPDVVLCQADVEIKRSVSIGSFKKGLEDSGGSYQTSLVIRVGCEMRQNYP